MSRSGSAALLAVTVMLLSACSTTPKATGPGPAPPHGSGPVATLVAGDPNPPPWPAEVGGPSPNLPNCNNPLAKPGGGDATPIMPKTLRELADQSWRIVVADAVDQRPYWMPNSSSADEITQGWASYTATNFRVVRVVKGQAPLWIQRQQLGALPGSLPCSPYTTVIWNEPPPKVGSQYLLFDWSPREPGGGLLSESVGNPAYREATEQGGQGSSWRFLVINGVVHSEGEFNHEVESMRITPQPLDALLRSVGL